MGAISDGSFLKYTRCSDGTKIDIAKCNRLNGIDDPSVVGCSLVSMSTQLPDLLSGILNKRTEHSSNDPDAAESIKNDIDKVLNDVGCTNISEVSAKIVQTESDIKSVNENIKSTNANITNIQAGLNNIDSQISSLQGQITDENKNLIDTKIKELEFQKKELEASLKTNKEQLDKLNKTLETDENLLKKCQSAEKELKVLEKQLKKAEGKEAIENLRNDETVNITKLVKKIKTAQSKNDTKSEKILKQQLNEAADDYYEKHKMGDNVTIDNLFKMYQK